ncbi:MAG TPA: phosphoglycolate phosphatase [Methanoregulaceae archaeon]|nr:MAG: phosphoglycolate phosphatase [Methanolinea sp.]HON81712.1 phosphoglycolate phosphatase [Methanoregulaceae archaeon]HPD10481.1 phosphoglycolate phosphatase [Methanoregulaceae archaeon]HRT15500.1 phosphoglycolate phosphatase [Methanoregulaceae archaeon]HRU31110.1 phosphoglycolate phosphatase [Methanoregulaceae archaeon]
MLKGIVTDIDGTITDRHRRIHTGAISALRELCDYGVEVVLASGNTPCFMDAISRMIGTQGSFIAENGGVYRAGYTGDLCILGDQSVVREALETVITFYQKKDINLDMYSPTYRFADCAFARTVHPGEVREIVQGFPVEVIDTGFAIHIQARGISKGRAFLSLTRDLGLSPADFLAVGDAENDIELIKNAGIGVAVGNAPEVLAAAATWVSENKYGEGFIEALTRYKPYFLER